MTVGMLYTVGTGPGDPELVTVKAARLIRSASVVAYFAKRGAKGHARLVADSYLAPGVEELRFEYPFTTELPRHDEEYRAGIAAFYDTAAAELRIRLNVGRDVVLLCEGDPFFFGSAMYLFDRLGGAYASEVIPGISGMSGCWTRARLPMLHGNEVFTVVPGTLPLPELVRRLQDSDAAVVMKLGRNMPKVRAALELCGITERAVYVERGTMSSERIVPVSQLEGEEAPYFSVILVPGRRDR